MISFFVPIVILFVCILDPGSSSGEHQGNKRMHTAVVVLLSVLGSIILIVGAVCAYKYWQKRKRAQDQARFLKLFEEGDDIEDELGLEY